MKGKFVVELELPKFATKTDAKGYVEDAVKSWHGSLFPGDFGDDGDPMFDLDSDTVKVRFFRRK
jgi:hypothetical protein